MDDEYGTLTPLRDQAADLIGDNVLALGLPPAAEEGDAGSIASSSPESGPSASRAVAGGPGATSPPDGDGRFQIALGPWEKRSVLAGMHAVGADKGFDRTLGQITGGEFSADEIQVVKNRALDAAKWGDVLALKGIGEGPPVKVTPAQKATIDRLMGQLGSDALGAKARAAYGRAISAGQIKVR